MEKKTSRNPNSGIGRPVLFVLASGLLFFSEIRAGGNCPEAFMIAEAGNCGSYTLSFPDGHPDQTVVWQTTLNGVPWEETTFGTEGYTQFFPGPDVYEVCATYVSPDCPEGVFFCQTFEAAACETNTCGYFIQITQFSCSGLTFALPGLPESTEVTWDMGDGNTVITAGGAPFSYVYANEGCYGVFATFQTALCPEGAQVFHFAMGICDVFNCSDVTLSPVPDGIFVVWWLETPDGVSFHQGVCGSQCTETLCMSPGCFYLYVYPNWPGNEFITVASEEWNVALDYLYTDDLTDVYLLKINSDCDNECLLDIGYYTSDNNQYLLYAEPGGQVPQYWTLPDGSVAEQPSVQAELTEPGSYEFCAHFASPVCGELTSCLTIHIYEGGCTPVGFLLTSDSEFGGPASATWSLAHQGGLFSTSGSVAFTPNNGYFEFWECLPNGCYTLQFAGADVENPDNFGALITGPWAILESEELWVGNDLHLTMLLGLNSDCTAPPACLLEIEAITTDGFSFMFQAAEQSDLQPTSWLLPGNVTIEGPEAELIFTQNGLYTICATHTDPECGTVTACIEVEVNPSDCALTTIAFTAEFGPIQEQTILWEITAEGTNPQSGQVFLSAEAAAGATTLCLPDGCYQLSLSVPGGILNALSVSVLLSVNGNLLSLTDWPANAGSHSLVFGVNEDCGETVSEQTADAPVSVYPNPSAGLFRIEGAAPETPVRVLDLAGRTIATTRIPALSAPIDLRHLAPGHYILSINPAGQSQRFVRIVVER